MSPCGEFNISPSQLPLPPNLNLARMIALVTGARVNLGFHTALRLLRCGACVIASTRYPYDAQKRCLKEKDWEEWNDRLRIIGADFRTAKDVFQLVKETETILRECSYIVYKTSGSALAPPFVLAKAE
jgi:NAD(P)-dependent dehydrogenase (short-subunit alcohol dehydrogenase family)